MMLGLTNMIRAFIVLVMCLMLPPGFWSQTGFGVIKVFMLDRDTKKELPLAYAVVYQDSKQKGVGQTNWNGETLVKPLAPGSYIVKGVSKDYYVLEMQEVPVSAGETTYIRLALANVAGHTFAEPEVFIYHAPVMNDSLRGGGK